LAVLTSRSQSAKAGYVLKDDPAFVEKSFRAARATACVAALLRALSLENFSDAIYFPTGALDLLVNISILLVGFARAATTFPLLFSGHALAVILASAVGTLGLRFAPLLAAAAALAYLDGRDNLPLVVRLRSVIARAALVGPGAGGGRALRWLRRFVRSEDGQLLLCGRLSA
jgi:hypothetical protein